MTMKAIRSKQHRQTDGRTWHMDRYRCKSTEHYQTDAIVRSDQRYQLLKLSGLNALYVHCNSLWASAFRTLGPVARLRAAHAWTQ